MSKPNDPWANRTSGLRCASCIWFVPKATDAPFDARGEVGRCRRHAPTMSGFPVVFATDWCGDHRIDESKI